MTLSCLGCCAKSSMPSSKNDFLFGVRLTMRAADGGYGARFFDFLAALSFSCFDSESTRPAQAGTLCRVLTQAVGRLKMIDLLKEVLLWI